MPKSNAAPAAAPAPTLNIPQNVEVVQVPKVCSNTHILYHRDGREYTFMPDGDTTTVSLRRGKHTQTYRATTEEARKLYLKLWNDGFEQF